MPTTEHGNEHHHKHTHEHGEAGCDHDNLPEKSQKQSINGRLRMAAYNLLLRVPGAEQVVQVAGAATISCGCMDPGCANCWKDVAVIGGAVFLASAKLGGKKLRSLVRTGKKGK
jgi:hypothetical protein